MTHSPSRTVPIDATWTPEQCAALLEALTPQQELSFYAADHASVSDPGAYLRIQRPQPQLWLRKAANHGWSTDWNRTTLADVQAELYRNRAEQPQGVQISPVLHPATEGAK